jgi:hypothetical protein
MIAVIIGVIVAFSPFIVLWGIEALKDAMIKSKARKGNAREYDDLMTTATHKRDLTSRWGMALKDDRLIGLQKKVMVPKEDDNGNPVDAKGNIVDDPNDAAMVTAKDDDDKVIKEYRFDAFNEDYCNPHLKEKNPLPVDPGKKIPSWNTTYKIGLLASCIVSVLISMIHVYVGFLIPIIMTTIIASIMRREGKACLDANKATWDKIEILYRKYFGSIPDGATIKDMVNITGWEAKGESQAVADATVYANEIGKVDEAESIIHPKDKRGHIIKPRISNFRDIPSSMVITFDANFMQESIPAFIKHLNQSIGGNTVEWIAQRDVNKNGRIVSKNGWDFNKLQVWLKAMPPLPSIASLPEDLDETPWNIIRLGRSVNGEVTWDLSGQGWGAKKERDDHGVLQTVIGPNGKPVPDDKHQSEQAGITCPMSLVPLDVHTLVWTLVNDDDEDHHDDEPATELIHDKHGLLPSDAPAMIYTNA